jgi:hypothetical protein
MHISFQIMDGRTFTGQYNYSVQPSWFFILDKMNLFLDHVCFLESSFWETTFQTLMCLFIIRKVG